MDRKSIFLSVIDPVKELLILTYGSYENYLISRPNLLEVLLLEYDKIAGNTVYSRSIAKSIFLDIPLDLDPDIVLLTTIETVLQSKNTDYIDVLKRGNQEYRIPISTINPKVVKEINYLLDTNVNTYI